MPSGKRCQCNPKRTHERVLVRKGNFSVFQSPAGVFHPSEWSQTICINCGHQWRSKAGWVDKCPDATDTELKKLKAQKGSKILGLVTETDHKRKVTTRKVIERW